jgi:glutamine synthetase
MIIAGGAGWCQNKTDPGASLDKDICGLSPELAEVPSLPGSIEESLNELEKDHDYLLKGDVFTQDLIDTWISYKRERELDEIRKRPHPYEFTLYYDI